MCGALKLQVHFDSTQRSNMFISRLHPCSSKLMKLRESRNLKNSKISFASSMYNDVTIQNPSKIYLLSIWHEIPIILSIPIYRNIGKCDKSGQIGTKMIKKRTHKHLIFEASLHKKPLRGKNIPIIILM